MLGDFTGLICSHLTTIIRAGLPEVKQLSTSLTASNGEVMIQVWLQSLLFEPVLPAHSFRMKEANGCFRVKEAKVNSRDRYLSRALNPAQGLVKGQQHNSMNTSESHGPKDAIEILKINGNGCYWKLLGFLV